MNRPDPPCDARATGHWKRGAHISQVQQRQRQRTIASAGVPPPQGRAEGLHLGRLPGHDHRRPPPAVGPLVWCWDNLNVYLAPELADFAAENKEWLRIYRRPAYEPDHVRYEFNLVGLNLGN
jgi:hypothetical protein